MNYNDLLNLVKKDTLKYNLDYKLIILLLKNYLHLTEVDKINNIKISPYLLKRYKKGVKALSKNKPLQYIIGNVNFYGYHFKVTKDTLIPRFETEELVEQTIKYIKKYFPNKVRILEIGTGSGNIGLTLKKELPYSMVTLTDISRRALKVARVNAKNLEANVLIQQSNIYSKLVSKTKYDVIISNPPYLSKKERLAKVVKKEPKQALIGGVDGLKYYREILKGASTYLSSKNIIALEIGPKQAEPIIQIVESNFKNYKYKVKKDLQGRERMLYIFLNFDEELKDIN